MSIRPVKFNLDGSVDVWHDESGHGGTLLLAGITQELDLAGAEILSSIVIACPFPGCLGRTVHPVSGGCDPEMIQRLFVRKIMTRQVGRTWLQARAIVKVLVNQQDGPERFRLDNVTTQNG